MAPPGLALVTVSERAWEMQSRARAPRYYFDWKEAKTWADKGMTPFTTAVTAALPPDGLNVEPFRKLLHDKYGVVIAGGQNKMAGKMVRVGHLGAVGEGDVVQVLWAIEQALEEMDIAPADGRGVAAVTNSLSGVPA